MDLLGVDEQPPPLLAGSIPDQDMELLARQFIHFKYCMWSIYCHSQLIMVPDSQVKFSWLSWLAITRLYNLISLSKMKSSDARYKHRNFTLK
jgi:hypothetical protein